MEAVTIHYLSSDEGHNVMIFRKKNTNLSYTIKYFVTILRVLESNEKTFGMIRVYCNYCSS